MQTKRKHWFQSAKTSITIFIVICEFVSLLKLLSNFLIIFLKNLVIKFSSIADHSNRHHEQVPPPSTIMSSDRPVHQLFLLYGDKPICRNVLYKTSSTWLQSPFSAICSKYLSPGYPDTKESCSTVYGFLASSYLCYGLLTIQTIGYVMYFVEAFPSHQH